MAKPSKRHRDISFAIPAEDGTFHISGRDQRRDSNQKADADYTSLPNSPPKRRKPQSLCPTARLNPFAPISPQAGLTATHSKATNLCRTKNSETSVSDQLIGRKIAAESDVRAGPRNEDIKSSCAAYGINTAVPANAVSGRDLSSSVNTRFTSYRQDSVASIADISFLPLQLTSDSSSLRSDNSRSSSRDNANHTNFLTLPRAVRRAIFCHIIPVDTTIAPAYAQGMLINDMKASPLLDASVSPYDNLETTIMRVSKDLREEVAELLYGSNEFYFEDATLFCWWIRRISARSTSKITALSLVFRTQWRDKSEGNLKGCEEEQWYRGLCLIQDIHRIKYLHVELHKWTDLNEEYHRNKTEVNETQALQMMLWRRRVWILLRDLRGFSNVNIRQYGCYFASDSIVSNSIYRMRRPKIIQAAPAPPAPKKSLSVLIETCRLIRLNREFEQRQKEEADRRRYDRIHAPSTAPPSSPSSSQRRSTMAERNRSLKDDYIPGG